MFWGIPGCFRRATGLLYSHDTVGPLYPQDQYPLSAFSYWMGEKTAVHTVCPRCNYQNRQQEGARDNAVQYTYQPLRERGRVLNLVKGLPHVKVPCAIFWKLLWRGCFGTELGGRPLRSGSWREAELTLESTPGVSLTTKPIWQTDKHPRFASSFK